MNEVTKKRVSDTLDILLVSMIAVSVIYSFFKYYIRNDYVLFTKEKCDPAFEECLSEECDLDDPRCLPTEGGSMYYKETYEKANLE